MSEGYTILDRDAASTIDELQRGMNYLGLNPVIVGGVANQLNALHATAERERTLEHELDQEQAKWIPDLKPTPVIIGDKLGHLKERLRQSHDLDICFPSEVQDQVYINLLEIQNVTGLNTWVKPERRQIVVNNNGFELVVDYNTCAQDSQLRLFREGDIYNRTFTQQRKVELDLGGERYRFNYASPKVVAFAKILRGKKKDREDLQLLDDSNQEIDLAAIRREIASIA